MRFHFSKAVRCNVCNANNVARQCVYNPTKNIFHCEYCGSYDFLKTDATGYFKRLEIPKPKGFSVQRHNGELEITRDWFGLAIIGLTFFCLFWNGFMAVWYGIAIIQQVWMMAACGTVHGLVGLGLGYSVLAGWLNQTFIKVNKSSIKVTSGPIPVPGNKILKTTDIIQLYSKERVSRGESTSASYEVHAVTHDNQDETLITGLADSAQALFIEQQIERALGIMDQSVRGELER